MNAPAGIVRRPSVCPHDCPSACALDVEVIDGSRIGRVHGAADQSYTAGVVCAKVARYAERIHHPDRLTPAAAPRRARRARASSRRSPGTTRSTSSPRLSQKRARVRRRERLALSLRRHDGPADARRRQAPAPTSSAIPASIRRSASIRRGPASSPATGIVRGPDPREMAKADCVVIWGTNAVSTQVNVMTHAIAGPQGARREDRRRRHLPQRYDEAGRPRARACARARTARSPARSCMRCFAMGWPIATILPATPTRPMSSKRIWRAATRDGRARSPGWQSPRSRLSRRCRSDASAPIFRLGYGFSRQRNGAANMHAAACIAAVTGAWAA